MANIAKSVVGTKGASSANSTVVGASSTTVTVTQTKPAKGFRLQLQQMLTGLQVVFPSDGALLAPAASNTGKLSVSTMVQQMQAGLADYSAVDSTELAQKTARQKLTGDLPLLRSQFQAIKQALLFFYGNNNPQLAQFGLKPKSAPVKPSPAKQVAAVVKREQTRGIRHTQGPKQKALAKFAGQVAVATQVNALPTAPAQGAPTPPVAGSATTPTGSSNP